MIGHEKVCFNCGESFHTRVAAVVVDELDLFGEDSTGDWSGVEELCPGCIVKIWAERERVLTPSEVRLLHALVRDGINYRYVVGVENDRDSMADAEALLDKLLTVAFANAVRAPARR